MTSKTVTRAPLLDTMRAIVDHRASRHPVPTRLIDELRDHRLTTLVEAIERYNARVNRLPVSA